MSRKFKIIILFATFMLFGVNNAFAQDPRPTPTNVAPPGGGGDPEDDEKRGSISGFIYEDVNRDGQCVNTGVEGEEPIQNVNVQFTSSDGETIITHFSGEQGDFGLYAAGQSYWEITVMPEDGWMATTEATVYVPVYLETLNHENVNFCLSRGSSTNAIINLPGANTTILLPESGASAAELDAQNSLNFIVSVSIVVGLILIFTGVALEKRRRLLLPKPVQVKPDSFNKKH